MESIALIPARGGSKRIPDKNIRLLNGHPLIAYTISTALKSNSFSRVIVSTDDSRIAEIAVSYGAEVPGLRPNKFAMDDSPDIDWVNHALHSWIKLRENFLVTILRPTSPLRTLATLKSATQNYLKQKTSSSLRAMERVSQHPGKMWRLSDTGIAFPYVDQKLTSVPTHDKPTQSLEPLWIQNASLEITTSKSVLESGSISGSSVMPFQMPNYEGFDLNTELDWLILETLINRKSIQLPVLERRV